MWKFHRAVVACTMDSYSAAGASSTMMCALVPPIPKELTPARRGLLSASQRAFSEVIKKGSPLKSILGFNVLKFAVGASSWLRIMSKTFERPVKPAAQLACAMFPFTEPIATGATWSTSFLPPTCKKESSSPRTSMPSPTRVPVQWHSTYEMDHGSISACRIAPMTAWLCPAGDGAAYPAFCPPSFVTAKPLRVPQAKLRLDLSSSLCRITAPQASPNTVPSASLSKGLT
mmetsp:Transcript_17656/g.40883  ORF Transcript_17656/g.40883 Transcript_17656/m.40883 type:complete len:230 (-) Transcript_17656:3217-3906(-)